jgi:ankyrin repeat protein
MAKILWRIASLIPLASSLATLASAKVPLVDAVQAQDSVFAAKLIEQKANVNAAEPDGTTALHWAAHHRDSGMVDRLLKAGANPKVVNQYGASPLTEAAASGSTAILDRLLKAGADANSANEDGETALMILARAGNVEAVRVLIQHGANVNAKEKFRGQTALIRAAAQGQTAVMQELVTHGAEVNAQSQVNDWERQVTGEPRAVYRPAGGLTALLYSAREGCVECVKILAAAHADLNMPDPEGVTPLIVAVTNGHFDTAALLLESGADPNRWDWWGRTPLYEAVDLNTLPHGGRPDRPSLDTVTNLEMIARLLKAGANPNAQLKLLPPFRNIGADRGLDTMLSIGTTPLIRAAKAFDAAAIELLLKAGADPNLPNAQDITPTMAAAGLGSVDADTRGWFTTEDTQQRSIAALKLLLDAGGEINAKGGRRGQTPLHGAAFWGWNDVVKYLVDRGAKLDAKDAQGKTVVDAALGKAGGNSRGGQRIDVHPDTAKLLESLGARPTP